MTFVPADPAPFYVKHVFCCVNNRAPEQPRGCCSAKGAVKLRAHMKARAKQWGLTGVRINAAQCLDRCELGPTLVIYPEGVWYTYRTPQDLDEILKVHVLEGGRVARLMLHPDQTEPDEARLGQESVLD